MTLQHITIKNVGPITNCSLSINQFNLLIGEQATGKSTISKAVYFFRNVKELIVEHLYQYSITGAPSGGKVFPETLSKELKDLFFQLFGYSWDMKPDMYMQYQYADGISIDVGLVDTIGSVMEKKIQISVRYSEILLRSLKRIRNDLKARINKQHDSSWSSSFLTTERRMIHEKIEKEIDTLFKDDLKTYYIPAGRGLLTLMARQKTMLDYESIDIVNRRFMQFTESIQPYFDRGIEKVRLHFSDLDELSFDDNHALNTFSQLIVDGLKGDYQYGKTGEVFTPNDGSSTNIPMNYASSGQQELLWLYNQLYVLLLRREKAFVIIEEPEAHLYPTLQRDVLFFISKYVNYGKNKVLMTTHSPYLLMATNTLLYAGKFNSLSFDAVHVAVGKYVALQAKRFSGYKLQRKVNETILENLLDPDFPNEIRTELIDEVSLTLEETNTKFYYIEQAAKQD